jgi:hypothetical protein
LEYLLGIGSLPPSDEATGFLRINKDKIYGLIRPVDFLVTDMNNERFDDVFICNFGYSKGDFSIYKNLKNGSYEKEIIHTLSGAIRMKYENMDEEKKIVVLFAQEHETLMICNLESNSFKGEKILQFQPEYGATDFQLKDIDNDGDLDVFIGAFSINIGPKDSDVTKDNEISWMKL